MDKYTLYEQILQHEIKIGRLKAELAFSKDKLKIAYDYKDDLFQKQIMADENIKKVQLEYFKKVQEITEVVDKVKQDLNLYATSLA